MRLMISIMLRGDDDGDLMEIKGVSKRGSRHSDRHRIAIASVLESAGGILMAV